MKLLIVDDSTLIRSAIETFLKDMPFEIVGQAANGLEALELFRQHLPDYVTMDITMPEMDGLKAMKEMLKIKPDTRILIASAISNQATIVEALASGAKHYLNKPFNGEKLKAAIQKILP
ncbi:MAG: response regulator [Spirochaetes bacterium]|nr:response regulator [Spirochaetota bacterium]MBX3721272.1 response regulator [Turneriella sp.]